MEKPHVIRCPDCEGTKWIITIEPNPNSGKDCYYIQCSNCGGEAMLAEVV